MLKYTAQPEKRDVVMKNGNEGRDVLGDSQKRYRCPWAEKGKYRPRYEPIRLHDSLPGPLRKKNKASTSHGQVHSLAFLLLSSDLMLLQTISYRCHLQFFVFLVFFFKYLLQDNEVVLGRFKDAINRR